MKPIDLDKELKKIELEILQKIHDFCEANNIRYSLCFGTLIGAIRHKGFIPWDDDIDIMMPREDYEKFVATFTAPNYSVHDHRNDKNYKTAFAKVYDDRTLVLENGVHEEGVYVDIFPIDSFSSRGNAARSVKFQKALFRFATYKTIPLFSKKYSFPKQLLVLAIRALAFPFPPRFFLELIRKFNMREHDLKNLPLRGNATFGYGVREVFDAKIFEEYELTDFENRKFEKVKNHDSYLRTIYGDYMQLPPEDQRVPHHEIQAFWR